MPQFFGKSDEQRQKFKVVDLVLVVCNNKGIAGNFHTDLERTCFCSIVLFCLTLLGGNVCQLWNENAHIMKFTRKQHQKNG